MTMFTMKLWINEESLHGSDPPEEPVWTGRRGEESSDQEDSGYVGQPHQPHVRNCVKKIFSVEKLRNYVSSARSGDKQ